MNLRQLMLPLETGFRTRLALFVAAAFLLLSLAACGTNADESATSAPDETQPAEVDESSGSTPPAAEEATTATGEGDEGEAYPGPGAESGYPAPGSEAEGGYPVPEVRREGEIVPEPPNPERDLPEAPSDLATIGGVLVEEIVDTGFVPLMPRELTLGEIVETTDGTPAFFSAGSDSPKAEIFQTGVFVFRNVEPGSYGLIIDVGYTEFPVETPEGELYTFEVEAGEVLDLGQVITSLPD